MRCAGRDRVAVGVQPAQRQVPVVEIHTHHRPAGVDVVAGGGVVTAGPVRHRRHRPRRGQIPAGPARASG